MLGCRLTNPLMASAKMSMTPTAMTIAAAMTQIRSAIPTAVITESREKTMSMMRIWTRMAANVDFAADPDSCSPPPSSLW